jgi:hypothetical protein
VKTAVTTAGACTASSTSTGTFEIVALSPTSIGRRGLRVSEINPPATRPTPKQAAIRAHEPTPPRKRFAMAGPIT